MCVYTIDRDNFAVKRFSLVRQNQIQNMYTCYIGELFSNEIFLMWKFQMQITFTAKIPDQR